MTDSAMVKVPNPKMIFKYDIAFSFLDQDESIALAIQHRLEGRLRCFIYSERQADIAGQDGERVFNEVFGAQSRIVVVLYRTGWGTTPWTRIEETAIRNRAYNEGYDFVIFVQLEPEQQLPRWIPKTQLWVGLRKWGVDGAATVIDSRVQLAGGDVREESITDRALRLDAETKEENARRAFLGSDEGVVAAQQEVATLFSELDSLVAMISSQTSFKFKAEKDKYLYKLQGGYHSLVVYWELAYGNTLDGSSLRVRLFRGTVAFRGYMAFEDPVELHEDRFTFDRPAISRTLGWRPEQDRGRVLESRDVAAHAMGLIMQQLRDKAHQTDR